MKKFLQLPFLLVAALLSSIPISAHDFEVDGIYYDIRSYAPNDACVTFRGELHENYNTYVGNVVIPPTVTYNGITYPVTEIDYYAFDNCPSLTSITIPNSIIVIDRDAFTACFGLTEVNISDLSAWCRILFGDHNSNPINYANKLKLNGIEINDLVIPNDVTEIKEYAFHNFEGLTSVTIPNSVTSIGSYAFRNCENLKRVINLSGLTLNLGSTDDGYVAYYADWLLNASNAYVDGDFAWTNVNNENTLIAYLGNDSELDLPSDFRGENYAIGDYIFANRSNLNKVTIPKSVSSIANNAFNGCDGLTEINYDAEDCNMNDSSIFKKCPNLKIVNIGNTVKTIPQRAFEGCIGLTSITIPNSVTSIGARAFEGCSVMTSVTIGNSVSSIGNSAFENCSSLVSITIPNSVTSIGENSFYDCSGLTSITIGKSVTKIGKKAFYGCSNLTEVNYNAENCALMGFQVPIFEGCSNLKVVNIGNSTKVVPDYAFYGCSSLTSLTIDDSVEDIGYQAFEACAGLTTITIPNSINSIDDGAFRNCTGLTKLNYNAENCTSMGSTVFYGCSKLEFINIGNSVKSIPDWAFNKCSRLTSITIPNSVTSIGYSAFYGCTGLTSVIIGNSVTSIGSSAFEDCSSLVSITIPNSVTSIGNYAFDGCTGLISVTIPDSVTEIGRDAFSDCVSLQRISIPTLVTSIKDGTFYNCSSLSEVIIPNSVTSIGLSAFRDCSSLTNIVLPNNISSIDRTAFFGCMGLISTTFATTPSSATFKPTTQTNYIPYFYYQDYYDGSESLKNLDPNTNYSYSYGLKINDTYCKIQSSSFTTLELTWANGRFDATSTSSARLIVETNCDATAGTGYEWRRIDAPDIIASSKVSCPVVDGMLVGTLRNLNPDVYYKFRPYYTSASGNTYYGDWVGFYTADANVYFEPEVRTYRDYSISQNSVKVKGYALEGTDVIISQGFEYWETGNSITPLSTEDRKIVTSTGIAMSATISDLEYDTTYKYRAFVTTAKGTVYGEEVEFTTGCGPTGIENIEIKSNELSVVLRENPVTNTAWIKAIGNACNVIQYTITSMSGSIVGAGNVALDGEWNAIELNCHSGIYLMTVSDGLQAKTLRLIVR